MMLSDDRTQRIIHFLVLIGRLNVSQFASARIPKDGHETVSRKDAGNLLSAW